MGMAMRAESATEQMKHELHRLLDNIRGDLDRIEILTAALDAFSRPVPNYEPRFRHLPRSEPGVRELH
ncbi:MAG: hypothetical protein HY244_15390 [Rhizobiales bacterium]|nr:hypothetical protein [Hyphomicrobiales bacterium]